MNFDAELPDRTWLNRFAQRYRTTQDFLGEALAVHGKAQQAFIAGDFAAAEGHLVHVEKLLAEGVTNVDLR